jgi:hypothetical protein
MKSFILIKKIIFSATLFLITNSTVYADSIGKAESQTCDFKNLLLITAEDVIYPTEDFADIGKVKVNLYNNSVFSISSFGISYTVEDLDQSGEVITKDYKLIDIVGGIESGMSSVETIYIHDIKKDTYAGLKFDFKLVDIKDNKQKLIHSQKYNDLEKSSKSLAFDCIKSTPKESKIQTSKSTITEKIHDDLVPSSISKPKKRPKKLTISKARNTNLKIKTEKVFNFEKDRTIEKMLEKLIKNDDTLQRQSLSTNENENENIAKIIRNKVRLCWNPPRGSKDEFANSITLGLKFDIDGKLVESPKNLTRNYRGSLQAFEAARRAVIRCSPYSELNPATYDVWKELNLVFQLKNMAR